MRQNGLFDHIAGRLVALACIAMAVSCSREQGAPEDASTSAVARAVGRVPRGIDVSLSRQRAANLARANLLKLLKEKGVVARTENTLVGASIERFWMDGKYLYALAILPLKNVSGELNESGPAPSNHSEIAQPDSASPTGGSEK